MSPWIKNAKGRLVGVTDERYEFLLSPNPVHVDPVSGKRIPLIKSPHEQGFTKPTQAEIDEAERMNEEAAAGTLPPPVKPPKPTKEKKLTKAEVEAKVRDAEGDKAKYSALSDEEKQMYLELFEEVPKE